MFWVIVDMESCYLIDLKLNVKMKLCFWSSKKPKISGTLMLAEIKKLHLSSWVPKNLWLAYLLMKNQKNLNRILVAYVPALVEKIEFNWK